MNITNKEQTPGAKSKFSVNIGLMDTHGHSRPKRISCEMSIFDKQGPFQSKKKLSLLCRARPTNIWNIKMIYHLFIYFMKSRFMNKK